MKECYRCGVSKELDMFYKNKALDDGLTTACKDCLKGYAANKRAKEALNKPKDWKKKTVDIKAYQKEWHSKNPNYRTLKTKEWYANNKERLKIKYAVKYAVQTGKLIKTPCVICGESKVEGHHPDYSRPLDVVWLCRKHHEEIHHG